LRSNHGLSLSALFVRRFSKGPLLASIDYIFTTTVEQYYKKTTTILLLLIIITSMGSSSTTTVCRTLRSLFLKSFPLILTLFSTPTLGFASWLKCYVDLDPSEIIMYQKVVPASEATHVVVIEVQPYGQAAGEDVWWSSSSSVNNLTDEEQDRQMSIVQLPAAFPGTPLTLRVRLRIPPSLSQGREPDLQFVVEATTSISDAAAEAVEFIDKGVMCDGKRAFSRRHDEHVILQIDLNAHPELEYVTLVAGWASEMEAVTLTPLLTLIPARTTIEEDEGDDDDEAEEAAPIPPPTTTTTSTIEEGMGGTDEL
jgi:hypothetical protein